MLLENTYEGLKHVLRRWIAVAIVAALSLTTIAGGQLTIWAVDDDGQVSFTVLGVDCDGSAHSVASSIQAAINSASPGDQVIVCPGVYREQIVINKDGIAVRSLDGSAVDGTPDTVIEPPELVPAGVDIQASGVVFAGFVVRDTTANLTLHPHAHRLIHVRGDSNKVLRNLLEGRADSGTYVDAGILVRGGGVGDGLAMDTQIEGNVVRRTVHGILAVTLSSSNGAMFVKALSNRVEGCRGLGIGMDRVPSAVVKLNTVVGNDVGIYFNSRPPPSDFPGLNNVFLCNSIQGNTRYDAWNDAADGSVMDAELNWWGTPAGPSPNRLKGPIDFNPWLTSPPADQCSVPVTATATTFTTSTVPVTSTVTATTTVPVTSTTTSTVVTTLTDRVTVSQTTAVTTTVTSVTTATTSTTATRTTTVNATTTIPTTVSTTVTSTATARISVIDRTTVTQTATYSTTLTNTVTTSTTQTLTSTIPFTTTFSVTETIPTFLTTIVETNYLTAILNLTFTSISTLLTNSTVYITQPLYTTATVQYPVYTTATVTREVEPAWIYVLAVVSAIVGFLASAALMSRRRRPAPPPEQPVQGQPEGEEF